MDRLKNGLRSQSFVSFLASIIAIACGLLIGYLLLHIFNHPMANIGMKNMLTSGLSDSGRFAKVLYQAAPLLMTGLSVGFAFKTGLFNIGATGQYTVGAACALICAIVFDMPWWACMLAAMAGGAVWGFFPGFFKAVFNVNEVITSIMFNWIAVYLVNLVIANIPSMLASYWGASQNDRTASLATANPDAIIPKAGLDELMGSTYINISIFIAMAIAVVMYIILNKTTFGYELRACGFNRHASEYAGINARRNIILSMVIAGALSGIGGSVYYLAGMGQYTLVKTLLSMGFNGIPVALLASSNPVGTIFSALFVSYIQVGGEAMQPEFAPEMIDIVIAVIIYLSAFSLLMKTLITGAMSRKQARSEAVQAAAGKEEQK